MRIAPRLCAIVLLFALRAPAAAGETSTAPVAAAAAPDTAAEPSLLERLWPFTPRRRPAPPPAAPPETYVPPPPTPTASGDRPASGTPTDGTGLLARFVRLWPFAARPAAPRPAEAPAPVAQPSAPSPPPDLRPEMPPAATPPAAPAAAARSAGPPVAYYAPPRALRPGEALDDTAVEGRSLWQRGYLAGAAGDHTAAADLFYRAAGLLPDEAALWENLSLALLSLRRLDEARGVEAYVRSRGWR